VQRDARARVIDFKNERGADGKPNNHFLAVMLASNPMSGLSLRAMMERVWSLRNWVRGNESCSGFQSMSRSSRIGTKRFGGLLAAPRVETGCGVISASLAQILRKEMPFNDAYMGGRAASPFQKWASAGTPASCTLSGDSSYSSNEMNSR